MPDLIDEPFESVFKEPLEFLFFRPAASLKPPLKERQHIQKFASLNVLSDGKCLDFRFDSGQLQLQLFASLGLVLKGFLGHLLKFCVPKLLDVADFTLLFDDLETKFVFDVIKRLKRCFDLADHQHAEQGNLEKLASALLGCLLRISHHSGSCEG